ncbi:MAG TPA: hypothetical protein VHU80_22935, partial [Polyangiaceae bacterium]|nr:hypothetical protein [Polyangiaceae bacterium]
RIEWSATAAPLELRAQWPFLRMRLDGRALEGFELVRALLLSTPASFFVALAIFTLPQPGGLHYRRWLAAATLALFSPPVAWLARTLARSAVKTEAGASPA